MFTKDQLLGEEEIILKSPDFTSYTPEIELEGKSSPEETATYFLQKFQLEKVKYEESKKNMKRLIFDLEDARRNLKILSVLFLILSAANTINIFIAFLRSAF